MKPSVNPRYHLQKPDDLSAALRDLRGYWKFWSSCLLNNCGLPTARGIIITRTFPEMRNEFDQFLVETGSSAILIRHDKQTESPPYPRGGFLVGRELLFEAVNFFFTLDRIVAIYETVDPLLNKHNMNLLFESDQEVWVEVVGPGFDASDLQRGDITPHETFAVSLSAEGNISEIKLISRVDQTAYNESVQARKNKIQKKLQTSPSPTLAHKIRENLRIPDDLEIYLKNIDSPLIQSPHYQPIQEKLLRDTVAHIVQSQVMNRFLDSTGARFPLVFSTSLVNRGKKQVFWDIVSPTLKFEGLG